MSSKTDPAQQCYAAVFIMVWLFLAKIIFFDLFVAILVENFEVGETVRLMKEPGRMSTFRSFVKASYRKLAVLHSRHAKRRHRVHADDEIPMPQISLSATKIAEPDSPPTYVSHFQLLIQAMVKINTKKSLETVTAESHVQSSKSEPEESSLFMFGPTNKFRLLCLRIMDSISFQTIIYLSICLSCIMLIATPPAEDAPSLSSPFSLPTRNVLNKLLTSVFTIEFLVKIIAQVMVT
jgi:hypothetical protein